MSSESYDVLIAGGGVVGSSIAYFLSAGTDSRDLRVAVVERDPSYGEASTALSVGGVRQQFSTTENILLSLFSAEFFREAKSVLAVQGEGPELGFQERGYLFLAESSGVPILRRNQARQQQLGATIELLWPEELGNRFPWLMLEDIACGSLGMKGEGWLDPYSLLQAFKAKAREQGVTYLTDEVTGIRNRHGRVEAVNLAREGQLHLGTLVNAAGPRASDLALLAGIRDLPVRPRKRFVYRIQAPEELPGCPLVIDPSGVYFRPEGDGFLCGVSPPAGSDPDTLDLTMDYELFHETVWPALARRVGMFDSIRLGSSWAGHYAFNTVDQNAILGPHPELENFLFANGFSGHGLQHAPGIGRGLAELILFGTFRTLDLTAFAFHRFFDGNLVREENVV